MKSPQDSPGHRDGPPARYAASRCFPPIGDAVAEAECGRLLADLYGSGRRERYHAALVPRDDGLFTADLRWFAAAVRPPARVIECGAGTGTMSRMLAESGYEVTAADVYAPEDLEDLRRHYRGRERLRFLPMQEALAAGGYDAAISVAVLEHILRPDEALRAWLGALRPGGTLSLVCPNYSGVLLPLVIASGRLRGRRGWRYRSFGHALAHAAENLRLDLQLKRSGEPVFVRCWPQAGPDGIVMSDADVDAVHLPSARGIRHFLEREGCHIRSWGVGGRSRVARMLGRLIPAHALSVRIHACRGA